MPRPSQKVPIVLTIVVGMIATAIAWLGTRQGQQPTAVSQSPAPVAASAQLVETVVLPHEEVELPSGPHQRTFATSCTICHSTRLVVTQPPFSQKQWSEVIHKMVKNYGAPITPQGEGEILEYLTAVRGK